MSCQPDEKGLNVNTVGISPKVLGPALLQLVAGVVLLLLGNSAEVGGALVAAGLATAGVGGALPPGEVVATDTRAWVADRPDEA